MPPLFRSRVAVDPDVGVLIDDYAKRMNLTRVEACSLLLAIGARAQWIISQVEIKQKSNGGGVGRSGA